MTVKNSGQALNLGYKMAIKDLFDEQKSQSTKGRGASKKTLEELSKDAESTAYIKQYAIQER